VGNTTVHYTSYAAPNSVYNLLHLYKNEKFALLQQVQEFSEEKYNKLLDEWLKGIRTNKQKLIDAYEEKRKK
jgi:hypothetical protein